MIFRYIVLVCFLFFVSCTPAPPPESVGRVITTVFATAGDSPTVIDLQPEVDSNSNLVLLSSSDAVTLSGSVLTLRHDAPLHEAIRLEVRRSNTRLETIALWHVVQPSFSPSWPLSVSADRRYLVDSNNAPVFWTGDAAWGLTVVPNRQEVSLYLADRAQKRVNVALVRLIDHKFSDRNPPWLNVDGHAPFSKTLGDGSLDFTEPNELYWQHVDWVVREAYRYGITILAVPGYLGYRLGEQGWADQMIENGEDRLWEYGQWLGNRYKNYPNLVWVMGGDASPRHGWKDLRDEVDALANGIKSVDRYHLVTAHSRRNRSALDDYDRPWLDINSSYGGYSTIQERVRIDYQRDPLFPTFLIEGHYGNEYGITDQNIREQMYRAILSGAFGQIYGNAPQWYFSSAVANNFADVKKQDWKKNLDGFGANFLPMVAELMAEFPLETLVPDHDHRVLTSGFWSESNGYPPISYSSNLAIAYLPDEKPVTIDTSVFDNELELRWRDPANTKEIVGGIIPNDGIKIFTPPTPGDWIMILEKKNL